MHNHVAEILFIYTIIIIIIIIALHRKIWYNVIT